VLKSILIAILVAMPLSARALDVQGISVPAALHVAAPNTAQDGNFPVKPSQAAIIAQQANPGSVVLSVKLLPGGQYAVTLKIGGSVQRVMVNATNGALG
jgi:hypothetical protein